MSHTPRLNTILLEDSRFSSLILQYFCEQFPDIQFNGCFEDISDAIPYIRTNKIDLLFLDIELKQSNGFDVLTHLNPETIVVLTSHNPENFKIAQENGITHYLPKPFTRENFLKIMRAIVQR